MHLIFYLSYKFSYQIKIKHNPLLFFVIINFWIFSNYKKYSLISNLVISGQWFDQASLFSNEKEYLTIYFWKIIIGKVS